MANAFNQQSLFSFDHTIYWPEKYEPVVQFLQNGSGSTSNHSSLYKYNVHVIVLAACIGLKHKNTQDISSKEKKEISIVTFHNYSLSVYLFLIPLLSNKNLNLELFKDEEGEKKAISIFEKYVAGGLEILHDFYEKKYLETPLTFVQDLIRPHNDGIQDLDFDMS
jgi:dnd system-associated protein 4